MKYFMLTCEVFLLGPAMTVAGITGIVLMWHVKNLYVGVPVDFVCIWMVIFGVIDIWVVYLKPEPHDYGM